MTSVLIMVPFIVALITLLVMLVRSIGRLWLAHRVRMAVLERLEEHPELARSFDDVHDLLEDSDPNGTARQDFLVTGVILAVIGAVCVLFYAAIGTSTWAVGAYWGGVGCTALGFVLALFGLLVRFLSRSPSGR